MNTLYGRWDATDSTSVSLDGDKVARWNDISGDGVDLISSGSSRPKLITNGINGNPAIRFEGTGDIALASEVTHPTYGTKQFTWIVVLKAESTGHWDNIFSTNDAPWSSLNRNGGWRSIAICSNGVHGWAGPSDKLDINIGTEFNVVSLIFDGNTATIYHNLAKKGSWAPSRWNEVKQGYVVMGMAMQNSHDYNGYIGEALAYTSVMPETTLFAIVERLITKWGKYYILFKYRRLVNFISFI